MVVKADSTSATLVRVRDVAREELGAQDYTTNAYLDNQLAVATAVFQRPGSNARTIAENVLETMRDLEERFPPELEFCVVHNPTEFIAKSVKEVYKTVFEATLLVVLVVFLFQQSFCASLIPIIAIPVSA
ncbi:MAG: efflux RND transporter permease subunit [Parvularculaceae bacterium]|nr:efflux RND transporter permease subunit [Parvularculaceae bacterium]